LGNSDTWQDYFSNNAGADKIRTVKGQLDEITSIMVQNIGASSHFANSKAR
jgi:hypothetical protein